MISPWQMHGENEKWLFFCIWNANKIPHCEIELLSKFLSYKIQILRSTSFLLITSCITHWCRTEKQMEEDYFDITIMLPVSLLCNCTRPIPQLAWLGLLGFHEITQIQWKIHNELHPPRPVSPWFHFMWLKELNLVLLPWIITHRTLWPCDFVALSWWHTCYWFPIACENLSFLPEMDVITSNILEAVNSIWLQEIKKKENNYY